MSEPKRIQRKRTKGWRMPANTVYVGRPTKWGNPYAIPSGHIDWSDVTYPGGVGIVMSHEECLDLHRCYAVGRHLSEPEWLAPLRGKNLACWCPLDRPCHADVLLELANR